MLFVRMRRSNSDTALDQRHVEGTTASEPYADPTVQPPNEASVRASVKVPRQKSAAEQNPKQSRQQAAQQNGQKQQSPDGADGGEAFLRIVELYSAGWSHMSQSNATGNKCCLLGG